MRNKKIITALTTVAAMSIIACGCGKDDTKSDTEVLHQSEITTELETETSTELESEEETTEEQKVVNYMDVETKNASASEMLLGRLNEPFYSSGKEYWIYKDTTGKITSLITNKDYVQDDSLNADIKDVEVVENEVYYTVVYSKYNEAVSIGWRDGYDWVRTEVYKKNLSSGEVKKVYDYSE